MLVVLQGALGFCMVKC